MEIINLGPVYGMERPQVILRFKGKNEEAVTNVYDITIIRTARKFNMGEKDKSAHNKVEIWFADGTFIIRTASLCFLMEQLPGEWFFLFSRDNIINMMQVKTYRYRCSNIALGFTHDEAGWVTGDSKSVFIALLDVFTHIEWK